MTAAIMLQGTGSDVGKTVLVAGLCRLARRRGLSVAPFKAQNMSNNAAVARRPGGGWGEISRAQWLQALACGRAPSTDMNPVLLKPEGGNGSQVVVQGEVRGRARARDYQAMKPGLLKAVLESYGRIARTADLVVVEGAGSPAEVNLRAGDIANMGFARAAGVPVVLVGDIDRGGVIASLVGTRAVVDPADAAMIRGFLINKFRGDISLFDEGLRIVTRHTGWPSLGVVPWVAAAGRLPAEDSVVLERLAARGPGRVRIAVPRLPAIANFDDLDPLRAEPEVEVMLVEPGTAFPEAVDAVLLPGSKSTIADMRRLAAEGWVEPIRRARRAGAVIVGLCGGYQMLGRVVRDPNGVEDGGEAEGLGLLDVETVLGDRKTLAEREARWCATGDPLEGYEIHMGATSGPDRARGPMAVDGVTEGAASEDGRVWGSYLHGIFASGGFRRAFLATLGAGSDGADHLPVVGEALDELAAELERRLDVEALLAIAARAGEGARRNEFD